MKHNNIFWGGLLISLGVLFILKNTNVINFNWFNLFRLWPMILIMIGISFLPVKSFIKTIGTLLVLGLSITLLISDSNKLYHPFEFKWEQFGQWDDADSKNETETKKTQHFYEPYKPEITEASLSIDAVAGKFKIRDTGEHLLDFIYEGSVEPYVYSSSIDSNHQYMELNINAKSFKYTNPNKEIEIKLHPSPIWDFRLETGAAKIEMDLRNFKTKKIEIDGGASSIDLYIGSKYANTELEIESGVSSIDVRIPKDSGCEIKTDTFLSSRSFNNFKKIKHGLFQTEGFDEASNKIYISIDAAITSLNVVRY